MLNYKYHRIITIDITNIDADLTHFPITLKLGTSVGLSSKDVSSIFDELGANSKKIAITKSDGETQLYAEVELWDSVNEVAILHVSKSDLVLPDDATYDLYFYYDSTKADNTTYIGTTAGSSPATNVWDSNFVARYGMNDLTTSSIADSKGLYNGTKVGANEPTEVDAKVGKGQDFDGTDDKIIASPLNFSGQSSFTVESFVKTTVETNKTFVGCGDNTEIGNELGWLFGLGIVTAGKLALCLERNRGSWYRVESSASINDNVWHHIAGTHIGTNGAIALFIDGGADGAGTNSEYAIQTTGNQNLGLGVWTRNNGVAWSNFFAGIIDEVRISSVARSAAWLKATNYSLRDGLVTWGDEQEGGGTTEVEKVSIIKWSIYNNTSKINTVKWNINNILESIKTIKWNINDLVEKTRTMIWAIEGFIEKIITTKWQIYNFIEKNNILKWYIKNFVEKNIITKWNIKNFIEKISTIKWHIIESWTWGTKNETSYIWKDKNETSYIWKDKNETSYTWKDKNDAL